MEKYMQGCLDVDEQMIEKYVRLTDANRYHASVTRFVGCYIDSDCIFITYQPQNTSIRTVINFELSNSASMHFIIQSFSRISYLNEFVKIT